MRKIITYSAQFTKASDVCEFINTKSRIIGVPEILVDTTHDVATFTVFYRVEQKDIYIDLVD